MKRGGVGEALKNKPYIECPHCKMISAPCYYYNLLKKMLQLFSEMKVFSKNNT
jgi:hypothetical protein